jgi:hypothetical protein
MRAHFLWSYYMPENTRPDRFTEVLLSENEATWFPTTQPRKSKTPGSPKFPPDKNIDLWLKYNAPLSFEQLADIRYALYHHCSREDFTISMSGDDQFSLTGRYNALQVVNDDARHYLLWKLRLLGRKNKWIGALPQTRRPKVMEL